MPLTLETTAEDTAYEQAATGEKESSTPAPKAEAKAAPEPKETAKPVAEDKPADDDGGEEVKVEAEAKKVAEKPKELPRVAAPKMVKLGALQEERGKRRDAQEAAEQYQTKLLALEAEVERLKNPPKAAPDPTLDPDGHNRWKIEQLESRVATYDKETGEQKKQREQYETVQKRVVDAGQYEIASLEEFKTARPEQHGQYMEAVKFYQEAMGRLLPSMGIRGDAVTHTINDILLRAVEDARENGENAAERIWNLAGSLGYRPTGKTIQKQAEEETVEVEDRQTDETLKAVTSSLEKLTTLAEGQRASKSIAASGGKGGKNLTLNEILSSSEGTSLLEESDLDKLSMKQARKLMGG